MNRFTLFLIPSPQAIFCLAALLAANANGSPQTITWLSPTEPNPPINVPLKLRARATSRLPLAFRVDSGPAEIRDGSLVITNIETVIVVAEQAGSAEYSPASAVKVVNPVAEVQMMPVGSFSTIEYAYVVQMAGTTAYVGTLGAGLNIIDAQDPALPVLKGHFNPIDSGSFVSAIRLVGTLAYTAWGWGGFRVIDLSDPKNPVPLITVGGGEYFNSIEVVGDKAYVVEGHGLRVFDVANPAKPKPMGSILLDTGGNAHGIWLSGKLALVAVAGYGVRVVDLSDPNLPKLLGRWDPHDTRTSVTDMVIVGNRAYLALGSGGLIALDLTDPSKPSAVRFPEVRSYCQGLATDGHELFATSGGRLKAFDIRQPDRIVEVGDIDLGGFAYNLEKAGDLVFVAGQAGLRILKAKRKFRQSIAWQAPTVPVLPLDVPVPLQATNSRGFPVSYRVASGPASIRDGFLTVTNSPVLTAVSVVAEHPGTADMLPATSWLAFNQPTVQFRKLSEIKVAGPVYGLSLTGNLLVAADPVAGLNVFDATNPAGLVHLGGRRTVGVPRDVEIQHSLAYVADQQGGLDISDISTPRSPRRVGTFASGVVWDVGWDAGGALRDGRIYLANDSAGLQIIDVRDRANPVRLGGLITEAPALKVSVEANVAYVATGFGGLVIVNVRGDQPVELSTFPSINGINTVQVVRRLAYLADGRQFVILDVQNPARPRLLGQVTLPARASAIEVVGRVAYVAAGSEGLLAIDVSNPSTPVIAGGITTDGSAEAVRIRDNLAFVAASEGGLQVFEMKMGIRPSLASVRLPASLEKGDSVTLPATTIEGAPLQFEVVDGPGRIAGGRLVFGAAGTVIVRVSVPGTDRFVTSSEERAVRVETMLLKVHPEFSGGGLLLSWRHEGDILESAPGPTGPWSPISSATSPFQVISNGNSRYFRLFRP